MGGLLKVPDGTAGGNGQDAIGGKGGNGGPAAPGSVVESSMEQGASFPFLRRRLP